MTSADYKAPYIDVIDNTNYSYSKNDYNEDITDEPYVNNSNIKIRLGRLDGLAYDGEFLLKEIIIQIMFQKLQQY